MSIFFRRGKSNATFILTMAGAAPTVAELAAGTDLSKAITAISGFDTTLNRVNTPIMDYSQEAQTEGPQQFSDASMTLIEDDGTAAQDSTARTAAYAAMAEGTSGYMILAPRKRGTPAAADKVEIWPVKVGARNRDWSLEGQPARYTVQFAITGSPVKDATVLA